MAIFLLKMFHDNPKLISNTLPPYRVSKKKVGKWCPICLEDVFEEEENWQKKVAYNSINENTHRKEHIGRDTIERISG
jgi:hypothetical protein